MDGEAARHVARIEVRIREIAQLFNSLDPSPFMERDLDDDAEEYIVGWARELPPDAEIVLAVHLPRSEVRTAAEQGLQTAISNYFAARAAMLDRDLRELFRTGWRNLSIGIPVLVACLVASQLARASMGAGPISRAVEESLIFVGWVANWKPIETFLYDWWPVRRRRDLYVRLARARLEIEAG